MQIQWSIGEELTMDALTPPGWYLQHDTHYETRKGGNK